MKLADRFSEYREKLIADIKDKIPDGELKFNKLCGRCEEMTFEGIEKHDGKVWAKYYIYEDCEHYEEHLDMFTMDELFVLCNAIDVTMGERE